ncbi:allene oxide cyclase barrel-like domain-containing protein [Nocardia goodfellowii]
MIFVSKAFRAAVVIAIAATGALAAWPATASAADQTLVLNAIRTEQTVPSTPEVGDTYIVEEDLTDDSGKAAGTAQSNCTVTGVSDDDPPQAYTNCDVTLQLADGDLFLICHIKRTLNSSEGHPCGVVGGTDTYRLARGDGSISFPDKEKVVFDVQVSTS